MYKLSRILRLTKAEIPLGVLVVALLFIIYSPVIHADTHKIGIVTAECLNVRREPSTSATIVGQLLKDTEVVVNGSSGEWYNITYSNLTGWVFGDYLTVKETTLSASQSAQSEEAQGSSETGVVTATVLNVRETAGTSAKVVAQFKYGVEVKVLDKANTDDGSAWYKVNYGSTTGWVSGEYVSFSNEPIDEGVVNVDVANIRSGPGLNYGIVTQYKKGQKVNVYSWSGEWYKIKTENGDFAWIFGELLTTRKSLIYDSTVASRGGSASSETASTLGQKIVEYAKKFLGVKYVWGGTSPSGFDCSGLVQYVYRQFGIKLNRVAADQAKQGTTVSRSQLKPGDLVFFNTDSDSTIDHVGIYIGNNQFIHASMGRGKVLIDPLNSGYYSTRLVTAKRVINQ